MHIRASDIKNTLDLELNTREYTITYPRGRPLEWVLSELTTTARNYDYFLSDGAPGRREGSATIVYSPRKRKDVPVRVILHRGARFRPDAAVLCIYIENFDFSADEATVAFLNYPLPITVGIAPLPGRSDWVARVAEDHRKEILIAQPLESSHRLPKPFRDSRIMLHHDSRKIDELIEKSRENIPIFAGFSTFGGERILNDTRSSYLFCKAIKPYSSFLLNTTTQKPIRLAYAADSAKVQLISVDEKFAQEQVQSNNAADSLFDYLTLQALNKGTFVVSLPQTKEIISALNRNRPLFLQRGIVLVSVSDFARKFALPPLSR